MSLRMEVAHVFTQMALNAGDDSITVGFDRVTCKSVIICTAVHLYLNKPQLILM